jgi:hypothetical protein
MLYNPKPFQKSYPVIKAGRSGEKYLLKVVAKHTDRYNLFFGSLVLWFFGSLVLWFFGSPAEISRKMSILKEYSKSIVSKRNYDEIQYSVVLFRIMENVKKKLIKF